METALTAERSRLLFLGRDDRERLNRFVMASPQGHFRQLHEWGDVIGYDGTRVVHLGVERNGELRAALAVCVRRIPRTPWSYLTGLRGPVLDLDDQDALRRLGEGVHTIAQSQRAVFMRVDPDYPDEHQEIRRLMAGNGFVHVPRDWSSLGDPRIVMRVDLRPTETKLLAAMRKKHRQHIHGAEKRGLRIRAARNPGDVDRFAHLMTAHGRDKAFAVREPRYFHALWNLFVRRGLGELLVAEWNGRVCAGGLVLLCGRKSWFLYTAIEPEARAAFPGEPIYWEVMRWAKERGAQVCDFGGTGTGWPPTEDSPAYPRYFFKLGFDAQPVYLTGYYDLVFRPSLYRLARLLEERFLDHGATILNLLRGKS